ncbi:ribonuclease P protein subunit p38 [Puntigrus tetrazona]|uniref:ribonuclease P protein subunit p38 n=1 Tax=Puntigrus tetrazona TaxID=1606681 RepID=UPI001C896166|nr:ribonuclease P protein subunit p38 [Puntigrus tetrazona]
MSAHGETCTQFENEPACSDFGYINRFPEGTPTLSKRAMKKAKKSKSAKTSLNNPYRVRWRPLDSRHRNIILNTLTNKLSAVGLKKRQVDRFMKWISGRSARKNAQKPDHVPAETEQSPTQPKEPCWSDPAARKQLAIGINEVTKGLERNELSLVLVCSSVKPAHMTCHLIPLSITRSVPACQVPGLSKALAGLLGLKCVLALGFRRGSEVFGDVVDEITPLLPPLNVAWIPTDSTEEAGEKQGDAVKGQKRKLEEMLNEDSDASPLILQPLKVKKTIPNPTKIRKPVKKKCLSSV